MSYETFCKLAELLQPSIVNQARRAGANPDVARSGPNGRIQPAVRLGVALRFFASGSVYDIMTTFGIGRADVSNGTGKVANVTTSDSAAQR